MNRSKLTFCAVAVFATTFAVPPAVFAGPSVASIEMQKALAEAEKGPDDLRRFVHRTRMIHQLSYPEVMALHLARKAAADATRVATAETRQAANDVKR